MLENTRKKYLYRLEGQQYELRGRLKEAIVVKDAEKVDGLNDHLINNLSATIDMMAKLGHDPLEIADFAVELASRMNKTVGIKSANLKRKSYVNRWHLH